MCAREWSPQRVVPVEGLQLWYTYLCKGCRSQRNSPTRVGTTTRRSSVASASFKRSKLFVGIGVRAITLACK